jgi:ketosteroid isomerase-like protein
MRRYLADADRVWDRLELEVDELRTDGEWVAALGRIRAHGGGRMVDSPVGWAWRVRGGRVVWGKVFESRRAALDLTGLHESPPAPGQA